MLVSQIKFEPVLSTLKYISLWGILLSSLIGCQPSLTSIEQISSKKVGQTISLTGRVVHLAPFVDRAAYQLEDDTGKIWVVTTKKLPSIGRQISIKGKVEYQSLPFAEQELGEFYLVELEQLPSSIADSK